MRRIRSAALFKGHLLAWSLICLLASNNSPLAWSAEFENGVQVGQITEAGLAELSGIAGSRNNPGVLWVHNDRNRDKLYAVSTNGQLLATYNLSKEVSDMEDIAIGPGPVPELAYIYCGDIGDNASLRSSIRVYRAAEPAVYSYLAGRPTSADFPIVERVTVLYPDGSHNAEALMVDPANGDVYIATKQLNVSRIYRLDAAQFQDGATATLSFVLQLDFHEVSSADISPDGREILLRQENFAYIWRRTSGQTIAQALTSTPFAVPVIGMPTEPNGEGVAFDGRGLGYYTVSEGVSPALYFFARTNNSPSVPPKSLIAPASAWKYLDDGSDPSTAWRGTTFSESGWQGGFAQLGYGNNDQQTVISFGTNKDQKYVTSYFRTHFNVENPARLENLRLGLVFDDGIAVYLNGAEVLRRNLATNATFLDVALTSGGTLENLWQTFAITNLLRAGTNTIAAEVHRRSVSEGDLSFDLQLSATEREAPLQFAAPPRRLPAERWVLDIAGPTRSTALVESSSDLRQWTNLGSVVLTNGSASLTNMSAPGAAWNFYRLRQK